MFAFVRLIKMYTVYGWHLPLLRTSRKERGLSSSRGSSQFSQSRSTHPYSSYPGIQIFLNNLIQLILQNTFTIHDINRHTLRFRSTSYSQYSLSYELATRASALTPLTVSAANWEGPYLVLPIAVRPMIAPPAGSVVRPPGRSTVNAIDLRRCSSTSASYLAFISA